MTNNADPDQLVSSGANLSGSTLFARQDILGSAGPGLKYDHIRNVYLEIHTSFVW